MKRAVSMVVSMLALVVVMGAAADPAVMAREASGAVNTPVADPVGPDAQFELGMRYGRGDGVPRDDHLARQWLARAASAGHLRARYALGWLYYAGRGVPQDYAKAAELFLPAAQGGDAEAQYMMGVLSIEGRGVEKDSKRSLMWMRKAALQGHPGARQVLRGLFGPNALPKPNAQGRG